MEQRSMETTHTPPNPLEPFLQRFGVVILDGALATELERRGADLDDPLWSAKLLIEDPEAIRRLHYDYLLAGADVLITATYQASFQGFMARGMDPDQAAALMRLSVRLAQEARDAFWAEPAHRAGRLRPLVAASIGCYGAFLADGSEYRGDYGLTKQELMDWHRPRMAVLAETGADLFACETIPCRVEGEALVELLEEFPHMPAWLSFSCCDPEHVCHGEPFAACVALADRSPQVVAVGLNCTPPPFVEPLLRRARAATPKPLVCYPNSGEQWDPTARCWVPGTGLTDFTEPARLWYAAGARIVGGCCRTRPEDIRAIAQVLREEGPARPGSTHPGSRPAL